MTKEQIEIVRRALASEYASWGRRSGMTERDRQKQQEVVEARRAFDRLISSIFET